MADRSDQQCWVLTGPTAVGKTGVALELARSEPLEIVSVDSMQVYRGMDIGTAKPGPEERRAVPHHMLDVLDPEEPCSAGEFARQALEAIEQILSRGRRPLLVGGSPMYLKAIIWGLAPEPPRDPEVRKRLSEEAERRGSPHLHERLAEVDPEGAERIHPNDAHRIVRALEVYEITGRPMDTGATGFEGEPRLPHALVGLRRARRQLYERINRRVDRMMEKGLMDEVKALHGRLGPQAQHALGYKQLSAVLDGELDMEEAVRLTKRDTRRYAKHQLTWFKHFPQARWVEVTNGEDASTLAERVLDRFATQT
jgi:tRNA dimethylallyltransferase